MIEKEIAKLEKPPYPGTVPGHTRTCANPFCPHPVVSPWRNPSSPPSPQSTCSLSSKRRTFSLATYPMPTATRQVKSMSRMPRSVTGPPPSRRGVWLENPFFKYTIGIFSFRTGRGLPRTSPPLQGDGDLRSFKRKICLPQFFLWDRYFRSCDYPIGCIQKIPFPALAPADRQGSGRTPDGSGS